MKKLVLLLFLSVAAVVLAGLNGQIEYRINSVLTDEDSSGTGFDRANIENTIRFYQGETHGIIDVVYRGERIVASSSTDTLYLIGSLTNVLGDVALFATVKALYLENRTSTGTILFSSGIATTSIFPYGSLFLIGSYPLSVSFDRLNISTIAPASITYRIWIVGTK